MGKTLFIDTETQASGTAVTSSNSNFNAIATAGSLTFDSGQAFHGTRSMKVGPNSGSTAYGAKTGLSTTGVNMWGYAYFTALPTVDTYLCRFLVGSTRIVSLHVNSAGKMRVSDSTGTTGVFTCTNTVPLNTWFRWEIYMAVGGTSSTGTIKFAYFTGDGTTATESYAPTTGTSNCGTSAITVLNLGKSDSGTYPTAYYLDDPGYDPAATDLPGPYGAGTPGSVSAVVSTVAVDTPAPTVTTDTTVSGGGPAAVTVNAIAPTVSAGSTVTVNAVVAGVVVDTLQPQVTGDTTLSGGGPATVTVSAPAPTISAGSTVSAIPAAVTISTPSSITVSGGTTVTAIVSTVSVASPAPSIQGGAAQPVPASTVTVQAIAPSVQAGGSVTVYATPSLVAVTPRVPVVSGGATVTALVAPVLISGAAPVVGGGSNILGVLANVTVAAIAPSVTASAGTTITAIRAQVVTSALAPMVTAGGTVVTVVGGVSVQAIAPSVNTFVPGAGLKVYNYAGQALHLKKLVGGSLVNINVKTY